MLKNIVERLLRTPVFLETPGDGGAGGGGNGDSKPQASDNNADHKPAGGDGKPQVDANGKPAPGQVAPDDARYKGMLADLQKERTARQKFDTDLKAARAELEQERRRIQALVGVNPKSEDETNEELVRQRLNKLNPALGELTSDDVKAIREFKAELKAMKDAQTHTWAVHGQKMLTDVRSGVEKTLGGKLSDRQAARITRAYVAEAEENPEFLARHEAGDPKLIEEFVKGWMDDFVEPGKRQALASELQRRPRVPGGHGRSVIGANEKPIDVKDDNAVADFLVKGFRERGGQFGQR